MAETVHLTLKADGAQVKGDSIQQSLGRQDTIECTYYQQGMSAGGGAGRSGASGARVQYESILIRKRIDKASPLITKALTGNQVVEGTFKFYRPSPTGDGTTEQFYTVHITQGRVASVRQYVPDTIVPASSTEPPLEEVELTYGSIQWTYTSGGVTHQDSWTTGQ